MWDEEQYQAELDAISEDAEVFKLELKNLTAQIRVFEVLITTLHCVQTCAFVGLLFNVFTGAAASAIAVVIFISAHYFIIYSENRVESLQLDVTGLQMSYQRLIRRAQTTQKE